MAAVPSTATAARSEVVDEVAAAIITAAAPRRQAALIPTRASLACSVAETVSRAAAGARAMATRTAASCSETVPSSSTNESPTTLRAASSISTRPTPRTAAATNQVRSWDRRPAMAASGTPTRARMSTIVHDAPARSTTRSMAATCTRTAAATAWTFNHGATATASPAAIPVPIDHQTDAESPAPTPARRRTNQSTRNSARVRPPSASAVCGRRLNVAHAAPAATNVMKNRRLARPVSPSRRHANRAKVRAATATSTEPSHRSTSRTISGRDSGRAAGRRFGGHELLGAGAAERPQEVACSWRRAVASCQERLLVAADGDEATGDHAQAGDRLAGERKAARGAALGADRRSPAAGAADGKGLGRRVRVGGVMAAV